MKKNAFTLIELIVIIVILGVIMLFSLPNITAGIERNKKDAFLNDAGNMINKTKSLLSSNPAFYPQDKEIVVFTLNFIDKNEEITKSQYGLPYNRELSFVSVEKKNEESSSGTDLVFMDEIESKIYEYKVHLFACDLDTISYQDSLNNKSEIPGYDNNSYAAPRLLKDNVKLYDINQDGYINSEDELDKPIGKYLHTTCINNKNYRKLNYSKESELIGKDKDKYSLIEEEFNTPGSNAKEYIEGIIGNSSTEILGFYY